MTRDCNAENRIGLSLSPKAAPPSSIASAPTVSDVRISPTSPCSTNSPSVPAIALTPSSLRPEPGSGSPLLPLGETANLRSQKIVPKHNATLFFDEAEHRYTLDNGKECSSVTALLDHLFPKFDADAILEKFYINWQNQSHPKFKEYGGKSVEEIKEIWEQRGKQARDLGTEMHKQIENMFEGKPSSLDEKSMSGLRSFLRTHSTDLALGVKGVEVKMVDPTLRLAGTADLIARGVAGGLTIVDWKRSDKDLQPDSWCFHQTCSHPLHQHSIPANTFYKYALQLNLYKRLLEDNYECEKSNLKVDKLLIVQLHPDLPQAEPKVVEVPVMTELVDCILRWREEVVRAEDEAEKAGGGGGGGREDKADEETDGQEKRNGEEEEEKEEEELAALLQRRCAVEEESVGVVEEASVEEEEACPLSLPPSHAPSLPAAAGTQGCIDDEEWT